MPVVLYERQRQILDYLAQYIQRNGFAPSLKEAAKAMNLRSLATVHEHIDQLSRKGVIKISGKGKTRRLTIVDKKFNEMDKGVQLPILAYFTDGARLEGYPKSNELFAVAPSFLTGKRRAFLLQVKGTGLDEEGVFENDLLVLEEESKVQDGDVVVALLEGDIAVLRKFFKETTRIRLEPLRSKKSYLFCEQVKIQGRVLGLMRKLQQNSAQSF